MKKIFTFIFLAITISTFSEVEEIVKNNKGNNVVLMKDNTWKLENEFETIHEFKNKVKLSNLDLSAKRGDGRSLTGNVTNNNRKTLEFVTYSVKWRINGQYSILRTFTIKDLKYRESKEFNKRIKLDGISGRDYKIEVSNFKWKK